MQKVQKVFITLGLMPLLFEVVKGPGSTPEMRTMAEKCLGYVHSDNNVFMGTFGAHGLIATLIGESVHESKAAANSGRHSM